jgi:hypothetical protein
MRDIKELKKEVKEYYLKNIDGVSVKNKDTGITIKFSTLGIKHLLNYKIQLEKQLLLVYKLIEVAENAKFGNFGKKKDNEKSEVIGYLNFNYKSKNENYRMVIKLTKDGKFYYHHVIKTKKN